MRVCVLGRQLKMCVLPAVEAPDSFLGLRLCAEGLGGLVLTVSFLLIGHQRPILVMLQ